LKTLVKRGLRKLTVVSPSFAVDCLETLEEVAIEYRDKFLALGGEELTLVPCLNDADEHATALADIVHRQLGGWLPQVPSAPSPLTVPSPLSAPLPLTAPSVASALSVPSVP
jgi:ferrochelatase